MAIQYNNRIGKTYYLREGTTKTGKPRYFFSTQQNGKGEAVDKIPGGYEIHEHPENAQVFLRKKRTRLITDIEEQLVKNQLKKYMQSRRYITDTKDEYITIYQSSTDTENIKGVFERILGNTPLRPGFNTEDTMTALVNSVDRNYTAMLRFRLNDKVKRTFTAERFFYRGSIDKWVTLGGPDNFKSIIEKYVKILGAGNFDDSPYF